MSFRSWIFLFLGPKWQFGPKCFLQFFNFFSWNMWKRLGSKCHFDPKKKDRNDISVLIVFVKKKKQSKLDLVKFIFSFMVSKKNSSQSQNEMKKKQSKVNSNQNLNIFTWKKELSLTVSSSQLAALKNEYTTYPSCT